MTSIRSERVEVNAFHLDASAPPAAASQTPTVALPPAAYAGGSFEAESATRAGVDALLRAHVEAGEPIGRMCMTGNATGVPHLPLQNPSVTR